MAKAVADRRRYRFADPQLNVTVEENETTFYSLTIYYTLT
jgi:hypothetical protein